MKYIICFCAFAYLAYQEFKPDTPAEPGQPLTVEEAPRPRPFVPLLPSGPDRIGDLIELVKAFEGFSPTVYECQAGVPTIGYGITAPEIVGRGEITEAEASELLTEEVRVHLSYVDALVKKPLTVGQRNALASFSFNCGRGSLQKIAARINRGAIDEAGEALLLYVHADGKPSEGLKKRRLIEYQVFNS
jgi:GH24 family phage-related lysozyme (muramidase)